MSGFRVFIDACSMYSMTGTDLLLELASSGAFAPVWSDKVQEETRLAVLGTKNLDISRRLNQMNRAFPDALVTDWSVFMDTVENPLDPDDAHVIAAALRGLASLIVTENLRHFPTSVLDRYQLEAKSTDDFLLDLLDIYPTRVVSAVHILAERRRNPRQSILDILTALENCGATGFVTEIRDELL